MASDIIFSTKALTKRYGQTYVLDNINIHVPKGSIYGLIGENGAGKTTLFRIITGLIKRTSGELSLLGISDIEKQNEIRNKIGCTIESPALYESMSVMDNFIIQCLLKEIVNQKQCIEEAAYIIGLEQHMKKKVRQLSYGMKQRLALGLTLLGDPIFLLLDEPTNGLDPIGIIEFRKLFQRLQQEKNISIMIASHMLSELELLATHYGIIHKGKMLKEISAEDLKDKYKNSIRIKTDDNLKAIQILSNSYPNENMSVDTEAVIFNNCNFPPLLILNLLSENNITVVDFSLETDNLETYFSSIISGDKL